MALRGVKVIEFAGLAPGPFCGMILRDFGASVIRVDKPSAVPYLDTLARGKRSLVVDFKHPITNTILTKLCSDADVLIDPYRPGVMEKFHLGPIELCKLNPKLIYARMTGFGQSGYFAKRAGHDINYIAVSGVLSMLGGKKPQQPINLIGDFAGGGLICALGICMAMIERYTSGKGQVIDANMVEGSAYVSSFLWTTRAKNHPLPLWERPRGENYLDGGAYFYRTYETKDGKYIAVGALEPQFFDAFIKGLNLDNVEYQDLDDKETEEKCTEIIKTKTQEEWCKIFDQTDACVTPVVPLEEAHKHPHNAERKAFMEGEDGFIVPGPAPRLSRTPGEPCLKEPFPGEHTREILLETGFKETEIQAFVQQKAVECMDLKSSL